MPMPTIQIIQMLSVVLFITGASLYYNIRRTLYRHGYPVSVFVYSGPCWGCYRELIEKSAPEEQRRLRRRKTAMSVCLALALLLMLLTGFIPHSA